MKTSRNVTGAESCIHMYDYDQSLEQLFNWLDCDAADNASYSNLSEGASTSFISPTQAESVSGNIHDADSNSYLSLSRRRRSMSTDDAPYSPCSNYRDCNSESESSDDEEQKESAQYPNRTITKKAIKGVNPRCKKSKRLNRTATSILSQWILQHQGLDLKTS